MARSALKLTMAEVAALAGVSANTICKLELGRHTRLPPHIARLVREARSCCSG
jgi:transcriptional regulator with XRE-family HTH domain